MIVPGVSFVRYDTTARWNSGGGSSLSGIIPGWSLMFKSSRCAKACETGIASKAAMASWMQTNRRNRMAWTSCIGMKQLVKRIVGSAGFIKLCPPMASR
jgi:hypothetical protein